MCEYYGCAVRYSTVTMTETMAAEDDGVDTHAMVFWQCREPASTNIGIHYSYVINTHTHTHTPLLNIAPE